MNIVTLMDKYDIANQTEVPVFPVYHISLMKIFCIARAILTAIQQEDTKDLYLSFCLNIKHRPETNFFTTRPPAQLGFFVWGVLSFC